MAVLKTTKRSELGSRKVRRLRRQGLIPAILYGHGEECVALAMSRHDAELAIQHGQRVVELDLDGLVQNALIKEVQWDTFGTEVLHVDLARVSLDERIEVTVPVVLRGRPAGVTAQGGVLNQLATEVTIECAVIAIPDELAVRITDLKVGDALHARDLPLPEGAVLRDDPDTLICTVSVIVEEEAAAPAEAGPAQPEVIGEKQREEEEGS